MKTIYEMTKTELRNVELKRFDHEFGEYDSILLLVERSKHDSGWRNMSFIIVKDNKPLGRIGGGTDIFNMFPKTGDCRIDVLSKSGVPRIWCGNSKLKHDFCVSSLTVKAV